MSEMVERVAKTIVSVLNQVDGGGTPWDEASEEARVALRQMSRSVVEAMREPTDEMCVSAHEAWLNEMPAQSIWTAMIEEALK